MVEVALVLTLVGIIGSLAGPNLMGVAAAYRAQESARVVALATSAARGVAQKRNEVVRVTLHPGRLVIERPATVRVIGSIRQVNGFVAEREFSLGDAVILAVPTPAGSLPPGPDARFFLCPTADATFVDESTQRPFCALGDMASNGGALAFRHLGHHFHLVLNEALGSLSLRSGAP